MRRPAEVEKRNPDEIWMRCTRFLRGQRPRSTRQILLDLADASSSEEWPDHYGAGRHVEAFEKEIADLLGKEAAVFIPTGTMTQQIALRLWCERSGTRTVGFHPTCHLEIHEQMAYQHMHGLHARLIGEPHSLLTLADLEAVAEPLGAILLELPQREIGGLLPAWDDLQEQIAWARERGVRVHIDGARLWESGPFYQRSYTEIAAGFDSVYVSFYKGLGGLAGAALAGPADFIAEARVWVRRHGGNVYRLFPYVVSAREQLHARLDRFPAYHRRAVEVGRVLAEIPGIRIKPDPPQANMMHVFLTGDQEQLEDASLTIAEADGVALFSHLRPTDVPGVWSFELSIGEGAFELSDEEIREYFRRIMNA